MTTDPANTPKREVEELEKRIKALEERLDRVDPSNTYGLAFNDRPMTQAEADEYMRAQGRMP